MKGDVCVYFNYTMGQVSKAQSRVHSRRFKGDNELKCQGGRVMEMIGGRANVL